MVVAITCGDPLTSLIEMFSQLNIGCFYTLSALIAQHDARRPNCPSDLLVEIERVKVLLRCRILLYPGSTFVTAAQDHAAATDCPTFIITRKLDAQKRRIHIRRNL